MEVFEVKDVNEIKEAVKENFPFSERSYPLMNDRNEIMSELIERIDSSMGGVLAARNESQVLGGLSYFFEEKENYCQTTFIFTAEENEGCNRDDVIENLFAALKSRFPGYEIYVGVDENFRTVLSYMEKHENVLFESSFDFRLKKGCDFHNAEDSGYEVQKVQKTNFKEYLKLHEKYFDGDGMYWDSRKVSRSFDRFDFYMSGKKGEEASGVLFQKKPDENGLCEIFGLQSASAEESQALLFKAASDGFENESTEIMMMVDDDDEVSISAASKCGFENTGHYMCFSL